MKTTKTGNTTHEAGIHCRRGALGTWCPVCRRILEAAPKLLAVARYAKVVASNESGDADPMLALYEMSRAAITLAEGK